MLTPYARSGPPPRVGIHDFMPIDAIGVQRFAHKIPVRHAWICPLLRIVLTRLRLPAQHVRSAGPSKGGQLIPNKRDTT